MINSLEDIGFYTLSDRRAEDVALSTFSYSSDLQRCELILTDRCNFKCKYCRGVKPPYRGDLAFEDAVRVVDLWGSGNLHNIRFSGGEPTLWPRLADLVRYTKSLPSIKRIAISTNGSADISCYAELIDAGCNDFSISLDACCSDTVSKMSGGGADFDHLCSVIKYVSKQTYCTVGVVVDDRNIEELELTIALASELGVSDIRVIPSAQYGPILNTVCMEDRFPILNYRLSRMRQGLPVRGVSNKDSSQCYLVKDDMLVLANYHFPCVIYMREGGEPIGKITSDSTIESVRLERDYWHKKHDCFIDPICKNNCLDVCVAHNNKVLDEAVGRWSGSC